MNPNDTDVYSAIISPMLLSKLEWYWKISLFLRKFAKDNKPILLVVNQVKSRKDHPSSNLSCSLDYNKLRLKPECFWTFMDKRCASLSNHFICSLKLSDAFYKSIFCSHYATLQQENDQMQCLLVICLTVCVCPLTSTLRWFVSKHFGNLVYCKYALWYGPYVWAMRKNKNKIEWLSNFHF